LFFFIEVIDDVFIDLDQLELSIKRRIQPSIEVCKYTGISILRIYNIPGKESYKKSDGIPDCGPTFGSLVLGADRILLVG
jgi:hypothetical protein